MERQKSTESDYNQLWTWRKSLAFSVGVTGRAGALLMQLLAAAAYAALLPFSAAAEKYGVRFALTPFLRPSNPLCCCSGGVPFSSAGLCRLLRREPWELGRTVAGDTDPQEEPRRRPPP